MTGLSTPAAIVLGLGLVGAFAGAGVYFGLRGRAEGSAATLAPSSSSSAGADDSAAIAAAQTAVEAQHPHLVAACWNPAIARNPTPAQVTLAITLEYGADGRLIIHSLSQTAGARADVTMCVDRELVLPATVSPPGRRLRVLVPIRLP